MTKRSGTRFISVLLAVFFLLSLLAGCGEKKAGNETSTQSVQSTQTKTVEDLADIGVIKRVGNIKWPISEKPITIKIMKPLYSSDLPCDQLQILQDYEKATNIHIVWDQPAQDTYPDKFKLIMNSGADLPDAIIEVPMDQNLEKFVQQGTFVKWNDLIEKSMPNLKAAMDKYPETKKIITTDAGDICSLPMILQFSPGNNVMMAREDWLTKLGLQPPVTTDDWYNVLKAFKTKDPNGNGKADEWPFSGWGPPGTPVARSMITAWGVYDDIYVADKLQPKDNKVHFGPIEPLYKEGVEWLHKLYSEGLIDPEILTNDGKAFLAKVADDKVGAYRGWVNGCMASVNDAAKAAGKSSKDFHIAEMPIMKGPYGDQIHMWPDPSAWPAAMVILKNNKYPTETAMWADYWYSDIGATYTYGIEGKSYTKDANGKLTWTDYIMKNPDGKTISEARGSISFGRDTWPDIFMPWDLNVQLDGPDQMYIEEGRMKYRKPEMMVAPMPQGLSYPAEENDRVSQLMTDIKTYVDESITKFIIGDKPMSEWDSYVKKVKDIGIDEVLTIHQKSYERYQKR